jgi:hypothetical protein
MKHSNHPKAFIKGLGLIETPEHNPAILHYLSPLERAAYNSSFGAFEYDLGGITLALDAPAAKALGRCAKEHIASLRNILYQTKVNYLTQSDARIRRFLFSPLEQQILPTRIYHLLKESRCRHMADVALLGESALKNKRGMGKGTISYLINLFTQNGCAILFL